MRFSYAAALVVVCLTPAWAKQEHLACGSHSEKWLEEVHLHRSAERSEQKRVRSAYASQAVLDAPAAPLSLRSDAGHIAIIDDKDGVVARRNPFTLASRSIRFTPAGSRYSFVTEGLTYDPVAAGAGEVLKGLGDDDTREIALPFPFPFYGQTYRSVFVNSDGNASFVRGDTSTSDRSLGRLNSGMPRIAPLFRDLDPTKARTGVTVNSSGNRFIVSWAEVPEYRDSGTGTMQTFQVRLYPDGKIEFAFAEISTREAVTGIAPGGIQGQLAVVNFAGGQSSTYAAAIAERFTSVEQIDVFSAAQKFYASHDDAYDFLVFFNTLGIHSDSGAVAYEITIRNNRSGYGDTRVDIGEEAGSKKRLQALLNMGPLSQYPSDPNERVPGRLSVGDTTLSTIAHEAGHLFLAYASVRDEQGFNQQPMLGYQSAHWAFTFNSDASLLEGNRIVDNGPSAEPRFQTTATVEGFSALDQYLMGLRPASEVPDTFYVANARGGVVSGLPRVGASFNGDRRDVRIGDIITAVGRRTPDHTVSQKRFRFAFILVTAAGQEPSAEDLAKVERYRSEFEKYFGKVTSGRASADATLRKGLQISTYPAAGVAAGSTVNASVSLNRPAQTAVTVLLRPRNGNVTTPASVTIPAGALHASFTIAGGREGVDELTAEASDPAYESAVSNIQVTALQSLRLSVVSGDGQVPQAHTPFPAPVRFRVTDVNELPYAGLPLRVTVAGGGTVDRTEALTDEAGYAEFRWTAGSEPVQELRASLPGGAAIVASAQGRPAIPANAVVNAASFRPGLTPGGIATVFGQNLGGQTAQVLLNGVSVPVFYGGTSQINFHVPFSTPPGAAELVVRSAAGVSGAVPVTVNPLQPGIFFDAASGFGAILNSGTAQVTQVRPAPRGGFIEVYATGLGPVTAGMGMSTTLEQPEVYIAGQKAEVLYSGLAPGFPGLYQVNVRIPESVPAGTQSLVVTSRGVVSNEVKIQLR